MTAVNVDEVTERVLQEHLLTGPRPGQCRCGFGDASLPVEHLGRPHSRHVVEELRAAGVLRARGPREWRTGEKVSIAPTAAEFPRVLDLPLTAETLLGQVRLPVCKAGGIVGVSRGSLHVRRPKRGADASEVEVTVRFDPADGGVLSVELEYR